MKILVGNEFGSYSFNPAAGTITISGLPFSLKMEQILIITDLVNNVMIYNFADSTAGAVSVSNNIITLEKNVSSMSSSDPLQIFVEAPDPNVDLVPLLLKIMKILESNTVVDSSNRQRVVVESLTMPALVAGAAAIGAVGTAQTTNTPGNPYATQTTTTANNVLEGPVDQRWRIINEARNVFANSIRPNLSFS